MSLKGKEKAMIHNHSIGGNIGDLKEVYLVKDVDLAVAELKKRLRLEMKSDLEWSRTGEYSKAIKIVKEVFE